jgi:NitT/TauT family transport system ATP-binding protein
MALVQANTVAAAPAAAPAARGGSTAGAAIELRGVAVELGGNKIVSGIDLAIAAGEFVCLLGPSGCGKSTLLNVVAGFLPATTGSVAVGGRPIKAPGIDRGVVFQSTESLFPWLTVRENVEYGPRMRGVPRGQRAELARRYIQLVGLAHATDRFPSELSGGMRQRVQLARVLVNEPSVVLMDEPFGALDAQTREVMQRELDRIWRATKPTILFITHDIWEAILLADRIVTMTAGPDARFKTVAPVGIPHPRDLTQAAAVALYRELRDDIGVEVTKTLKAQGLAAEGEG